MNYSTFVSAVLLFTLVNCAEVAMAQTQTANREATSAKRELIGRNFKLVATDLRVNRITLDSQRKLERAYALSVGEPQALILSALSEVKATPRLSAVCNAAQSKSNLAYRGTSMMYDSFGFVFKPSREIHCDELSIGEIEMKPLELTETTLKLALTIDHNTSRIAQCLLVSVDGMFNLWKDVTARCSLPDREGTFLLDID